MCWNKEVSLNTFLFSAGVLLLILMNRHGQYRIKEFTNIWFYPLVLSIIFMQLIEYFIWKHMNNPSANKWLSVLGFILILSQPCFSLMTMPSNKTSLRNKLLLLYALCFIVFLYLVLTRRLLEFRTNVACNGHLQWHWLQPLNTNIGRLFLLIWTCFFLYPHIITGRKAVSICAIITLLLSIYTFNKYNTLGSMWCWIANIMMLFFAFELLILLPFQEKQSKFALRGS